MKNKKNSKRISIVAIIIIAIIVTLVIQNVLISNNVAENEYLAVENTNSSLLASYIKKGVKIGGIIGTNLMELQRQQIYIAN